jgi:predicted Zn-dependent protease
MSILTEKEAKKLLQKVIAFSKADECVATLSGEIAGNIRYARNTVSTSGATSNLTLAVQSNFGKKGGVATINEFDDASIEKVVRRSEELARLAPENPEYMPLIGPQKFSKANTYFEATAKVTPAQRAQAAEDSIVPSKKNKLVASGFLNDSQNMSAMMNSKGLFAYNKSTDVSFSATIRTEDGRGSGWATRDYADVKHLDTAEASMVAIKKSKGSVGAKELEPGRYTVILEPAASVQLLSNMVGNMDQRSADEGRSFLSYQAKEGEENPPKNKLGDKLFDERVNIYSDPHHPMVPTATYSSDGLPVDKTDWIKNGKVVNLYNSRYWAEKTGAKHIPTAAGSRQFIMAGGSDSLEKMIKDTRRGVLVTRLWYIRQLDPQTLLYTGLTRDGTFFIENGEIKYPIKNFRFNESPIVMLNNIEALGKPVRINGNMVPPMKIRDFNFSSLSDAV